MIRGFICFVNSYYVVGYKLVHVRDSMRRFYIVSKVVVAAKALGL